MKKIIALFHFCLLDYLFVCLFFSFPFFMDLRTCRLLFLKVHCRCKASEGNSFVDTDLTWIDNWKMIFSLLDPYGIHQK